MNAKVTYMAVFEILKVFSIRFCGMREALVMIHFTSTVKLAAMGIMSRFLRVRVLIRRLISLFPFIDDTTCMVRCLSLPRVVGSVMHVVARRKM